MIRLLLFVSVFGGALFLSVRLRCTSPKEIQIKTLVDARLSGKYPRGTPRPILNITDSLSAEEKPVWPPLAVNRDTCPAYNRVFYFPRSVLYGGRKCWVLYQWAGLKCPYKRCRYDRCLGVKATSWNGAAVCRQSNYKCKVYYIWCPGALRVYRRYVCLPKCCSCMYQTCDWTG